MREVITTTVTNADGESTAATDTLDFAYDASGTPMAVTYNGTNYYYVTNLQGDVTAILSDSGETVVTYTYDAWGKLLSVSGTEASSLGVHNPLRYRGYVYDQETELYYLQSRYYDPQVGRFINADSYVSTGQGFSGNNMFAYCLNNPVNAVDVDGHKSIWSYLFASGNWGFAHALVQWHIVFTCALQNQVILKEVCIDGGKLRADLVDPLTGEVWEVKHAGGIGSTKRTAEAKDQVNKYIEKKGPRATVRKPGAAGRFSGQFALEFGKESYLITYNTPAPGVVLYFVESIHRQTQAKPLLQGHHSYLGQYSVKEMMCSPVFLGAAASLCCVCFMNDSRLGSERIR